MSGFDDIKGIGKGKDIEVKRDEVLYQLIEASKKIIEVNHFVDRKELINFELNKIDYTPEHIREFIYASSNKVSDYDKVISLGCFTSEMLMHYRKKYRDDKGLRFEIDGKGSNFDYLFTGMKDFDELIIKNFKGENICNNLWDSSKGKVLALSGIKNTNERGSMCLLNGNIEQLLVFNTETYDFLNESSGSIRLLIASGCKFEDFCYALEDSDHLKIDNLILINNKIDSMNSMFYGVKIGRLILKDNEINLDHHYEYMPGLIKKGRRDIDKARAEKVEKMVCSIDPNNTEKMLQISNDIYRLLGKWF